MSTNQPFPSMPALECRSGAKTSMCTGFWPSTLAVSDGWASAGVDAAAAEADAAITAAPAAAANMPATTLRARECFFMSCLPERGEHDGEYARIRGTVLAGFRRVTSRPVSPWAGGCNQAAYLCGRRLPGARV